MALLEVLSFARLLRNPRRRAGVLLVARDPAVAGAVRLAATRALTPGSPDPDEAGALAAMTVTDPDTGVRLAAVAALPRWQLTGQVKATLMVAVREDPVAEVRLAALDRLLRDGPDAALRPLLHNRVTGERDAMVFRTASTAALAQAGDNDADAVLEMLERRSTDANPEVRSVVVSLLADRSPAAGRAYRVVCDRLRDDNDPGVVAVAGEAARFFADRADLPGLLLARLTDPRTEINCAAARALTHWCRDREEVRRRLSEVARAGEPSVRCAALVAMAPTADLPDVRGLLVDLLRDREPTVRAVTVRLLGHRCGHDGTVPVALTAALQEEQHPEVLRVLETTLVWSGFADVEQFPGRFS